MAEKKKYNSILVSGRKDETLTYSRYVKDEESGESVKESLDKKVNTTDKLETQQIKDGAITSEKLAADSVGNSNLQDGSVSNEKLEDNSITNEKLAENSITKDKLKDNTIGVEKLDPELRQAINAATGLPEDLVETIQNVDDTLKDHQSQLNDKQSQIDDKQQQITANDEDISLLQTRSTQMEETIKSIAATGGASQATAVTYNNANSQLTATNIQSAVDELQGSKIDKTSILQESGEAEDKVMSQKAVSTKLSGLSNTKSGSFGWEYGHINPSTNAIIYGDKTRLINNVPLPKIGSIKLKEGYLVASCFELTALGNLSNYTSVNNISHSWKTKYGVVLVVKKANGDEEFEGTTGFLENLVDDSDKEINNNFKSLDDKFKSLSNTKSGSFGWEYGHINPSTNAIIYGDKTRLINNVPLPKIGSIKLKEGYLVASCFELTALGNLSNYTSVNNISHSWKTKYGVVLVVKKANGDEEFEGTTGFLENLVDDSDKEINNNFKSLDDKFKSLSNTKSGSFGWEYGFVNVSNNTVVYGDRTRIINNIPLPKVGSIEVEEGFLIASYYELSATGNLSNYATVNARTYSWNTKYGVVLVIKKTNGDEEIEQPYGFIKTLTDNSETDNPDKKFETYNTIGSPELYNQPSLEDTKDFRLYDTISSWYEAWDNLATQYPDWLKREDDIGKDESGKYEMRHYTLRMQHPMVTADRQGNGENKWDDSLYKYRHILINMGMHTDEKYAMLGSFLAIKNILESNENWARFIKNNFVLDIIPCACPWGLENNYNDEYGLNMNGVNINRDFANKSAAETRNIIGLVEKLLPLGLVGIIDTHNTGLGDGYFVCKKTYTHYNYYCLLTQMVNANLYHLFAQVFTNGKKSHFHTWNYESEAASVGQFHWYADKIGVLGCTMEIAIAAGFKGSLLTKSVLLNLITSFGTYRF